MLRLKWVVLLVLVACAGPHQGELVVPIRYPLGEMTSARLPSCVGSIQLAVVDARTTRDDVLGRRFPEEHPSSDFSIRAQGDVAAYVRTALTRNLQRPVGSDGVGIWVNVTELVLEEKMSFNSVYAGQVTFETTVTPPGSTRVCWVGTVTGRGKNYGRAGSEENGQETLNRAVGDATEILFNNPGFRDALCGSCSAP